MSLSESVVMVVLGAAIALFTQRQVLTWTERRKDHKEARGRARVAMDILSGVRGRREFKDKLRREGVMAYEPSWSEDTNLRKELQSILDSKVRHAVECYLHVVARSGRDLRGKEARLKALEALEKVLGAYSRGDGVPKKDFTFLQRAARVV